MKIFLNLKAPYILFDDDILYVILINQFH